MAQHGVITRPYSPRDKFREPSLYYVRFEDGSRRGPYNQYGALRVAAQNKDKNPTIEQEAI